MSTVPLGVIDDARGHQRRRLGVVAAAAAVAALATTFAWGGGGRSPSGAGGQLSGRPSLAGVDRASAGRTLSSLGLRAVEPADWFGRTQVLPVGGPGAAWLQAASFSLRIAKRGSDPIESMRAEDVVLTITTAAPFSRVQPHVRPLAVARDAIPAVRLPRHYFGLEESAMLGGGVVSITVWFGSRSAATRLLPVINTILRSMREQPR